MRRFGLLVLGTYLIMGFGPAWGDATIESTFKTGGIKGAGATEGTMIRRYQENKSWQSSSSKFTGAILSRITGGSENATITRVDKGVFWNLDPKNRTYAEVPIEPFSPRESPRERPEKPAVRITNSDFSVKKTGAAETINGFSCEEYLLIWLLEMEEVETKAKSRSTMTTSLWSTPETDTIRKAQKEEAEFHKALARKLGVSFSPEESKQMGVTAFAAMSGTSPEEIEKGLIKVKNEMSRIKGYPIRTAVNWTLEREKGASSPRDEGAARESPSETSGSVGGFLGGIVGRFTQKKMEEKLAPSGGKEAPFFSSTTEVKLLSAEKIPPGTFEIPEGYTKK